MDGQRRFAVIGTDARLAAAGRALARAGFAVGGPEQTAPEGCVPCLPPRRGPAGRSRGGGRAGHWSAPLGACQRALRVSNPLGAASRAAVPPFLPASHATRPQEGAVLAQKRAQQGPRHGIDLTRAENTRFRFRSTCDAALYC